METILLLEDQPLTRAALEILLRTRFPDATVDSAGSDEEAKNILERYQMERKVLDVAIVDIKVPARHGENPEVSAACETVRRLQPAALVVHVTGHLSDDPFDAVTMHIAVYHSDYESNPTARPVDKRSERWENELCGRIATYLVARQMGAMADTRLREGRGRVVASQRHQSATFHRAALMRDIKRYWKLIEPQLKEKIRRYFEVDESDDPIIVR